MANHHKFLIGDLVAYKIRSWDDGYLYEKDYGIIMGSVNGYDEQTWYKIHWAKKDARARLSAYSYAQLDLIARTKEA